MVQHVRVGPSRAVDESVAWFRESGSGGLRRGFRGLGIRVQG